jgi:acetyltransferase-like isoleucine patch superfamily enzyme
MLLRDTSKMDGAGVSTFSLPGATIGKCSWVAPGSVVRLGGSVDRDVIVKGDPAGIVFRRQYAAPNDNKLDEQDRKR